MIFVIGFTLFSLAVLILLSILLRKKDKCAYVVVMGDIGRSPRMQFHSLSLSSEGFVVYIVGYRGNYEYFLVFRRYHIFRPIPIFGIKPMIPCGIFKNNDNQLCLALTEQIVLHLL